MSKHSEIILEDKAIYGLNKVHKNVLRSNPKDFHNTRARVDHIQSKDDEDEVEISHALMDFVADGFKFEHEVVKVKAKHAAGYDASEVHAILEKKNELENGVSLVKRTKSCVLNKYQDNQLNFEKEVKRAETSRRHDSQLLAIEPNYNNLIGTENALVRFKPKVHFANKFPSSQDLSAIDEASEATGELNKRNSKSLGDLTENIDEEGNGEGVFMTEACSDMPLLVSAQTANKSEQKAAPVLNENALELAKVDTKLKWDDHLIGQLSENTARWIAMKNTSDPKQKRKLIELVEDKYGKYTHREVKDLEIYEADMLTNYEKRKIAEEKERHQQEKDLKEGRIQLTDQKEEKKIPVYRLPAGLKRQAIYEANQPDESANRTAKAISFEPTYMDSPASYGERMTKKKVTAKTLLSTREEYTSDMIASGGNHRHKFIADNDAKIVTEEGKTFAKNLQQVFPPEFTAWISDVNLEEEGVKEQSKPVKGKKRWTDFPKAIDGDKVVNPKENPPPFWNLMATTPDTQLKRVAKSNLTVAKIVDEWRKRWQTTSRWTLAEIEDLIEDMQNESANIRFQAIVICTRAVEQIQTMINKLRQYDRKYPDERRHQSSSAAEGSIEEESSGHRSADYEDHENKIFSAKLFETITRLLSDTNQKVKLSAAIAVFIILRSFARPLHQPMQTVKNSAEEIVRSHLFVRNKYDCYMAAQCLAIDGFCDKNIVQILLKNYLDSGEQFTKQQVTKTLADLSRHHELALTLVAEYLKSDHERERILACKLIPCLKRSITTEVTTRLILLMWYDMSNTVKKVASQTLGRTGRGRIVHDEIYARIVGDDVFEKMQALRTLNAIGIMTDRLLQVYLKCFRDEHTSVRELACRSSQCLFERHDELIAALVFMAKFDPVSRLKAMAIRALSLVGERTEDIRRALLWALQFELDPLIRTEACHCIIILFKNKNDAELLDVLQERHLLEGEPIVRSEIMEALRQLGYNPKRELPIVAQIKADVSKLGDKAAILARIKELDKALDYEADKKRLLWSQADQELADKRDKAQRLAAARKRRAQRATATEGAEDLQAKSQAEEGDQQPPPPTGSKSNLKKSQRSKSKFSKTISFNTLPNAIGGGSSCETADKESNASFLERLIMVEDVNKPRAADIHDGEEVSRAVSVLISNSNMPLD